MKTSKLYYILTFRFNSWQCRMSRAINIELQINKDIYYFKQTDLIFN